MKTGHVVLVALLGAAIGFSFAAIGFSCHWRLRKMIAPFDAPKEATQALPVPLPLPPPQVQIPSFSAQAQIPSFPAAYAHLLDEPELPVGIVGASSQAISGIGQTLSMHKDIRARGKTPEEAWLNALLSQCPHEDCDVSASLAFIKKSEHNWFELNGDADAEVFIRCGTILCKDGTDSNFDGATGNKCWGIMHRRACGDYEVILDGCDVDATPLETTHNGWRDIAVLGRGNLSHYSTSLYVHSGRGYELNWVGEEYVGLTPGERNRACDLRPIPMPQGLIGSFLRLNFPEYDPEMIQLDRGVAYLEPQTALMFIHLQEVRLSEEHRKPKLPEPTMKDKVNCFVFVGDNSEKSGWRLVLAARNPGAFCSPVISGTCRLYVKTGGDDDNAPVLTSLEVDSGK